MASPTFVAMTVHVPGPNLASIEPVDDTLHTLLTPTENVTAPDPDPPLTVAVALV